MFLILSKQVDQTRYYPDRFRNQQKRAEWEIFLKPLIFLPRQLVTQQSPLFEPLRLIAGCSLSILALKNG